MVEHAGSDRREIGAGQHEQHLQQRRGANLDDVLQHDRLITRVTTKGQVREHQVAVDEEPECLRILLIEVQILGDLQRNPGPDFTVILRIAFAQIMDEQREVQQVLRLDVSIRVG